MSNSLIVPPIGMIRHIEDKFNNASGISVTFAVADFSLVGSNYVASKSVTNVLATDKLMLVQPSGASAAAKVLYNSAVFDSGTGILTCTVPTQPTVDLTVWIMDRVTSQVHGTNVADLTYQTVSGNSIKFTSNMMDTTGVYDSTLGMTQAAFNNLHSGWRIAEAGCVVSPQSVPVMSTSSHISNTVTLQKTYTIANAIAIVTPISNQDTAFITATYHWGDSGEDGSVLIETNKLRCYVTNLYTGAAQVAGAMYMILEKIS